MISVVLLAAVISASQGPSPAPTETRQHAEQGAQERGGKPGGASGSTNPSIGSHAISGETSGPHHEEPANNDGPPSQWWFNFFLVVFTGALAILAGFQLSALHRQADLMAGQLAEMKTTSTDTHDLAIAAGKAAGAAQENASSAAKMASDARELAHIDQRARVKVQGAISGRYVRAKGDPPTFAYAGIIQGSVNYLNLPIANIGKTPAEDVLLCSYIQYADVVLTEPPSPKVAYFSEASEFEDDCTRIAKTFTVIRDDWDLARAEVRGWLPFQIRRVGVIYPNESIVETVHYGGVNAATPHLWYTLRDLTDEQRNAIDSQTACLVVIARLRYQDVFRARHKTLYCARWQPPSNDLVVLPYGNYAD